MSLERSISRVGNKVFLDTENDGWTFMNRGIEPRSEEIASADETGLVLVNGGRVGSSSGHLEKEAMSYFAQIAEESQKA